MQVNSVLHKQMVQVEHKSSSNEQYTRRECLVGTLEIVTKSLLE